MGLLDFLFGEKEELKAHEKLALISQRAKELHAKKKGKKTPKVWQESLNQAKEQLKKEGKI